MDVEGKHKSITVTEILVWRENWSGQTKIAGKWSGAEYFGPAIYIEHSSLLCVSTNPVSECARCWRSLGLLYGSAVICVGGKVCCSLLLYIWHSQLHIHKVTSQ